MTVAIITGSAGLVGSEAASHFASLGIEIVGIDNGMRAEFFGPEASTDWVRDRLCAELPRYRHYAIDIRDADAISSVFAHYGRDIALVIHSAAQPSHDWAASDPTVDFTVNANGTSTLLEATRRFAPDAVFIFMSTNKVYGDRPNQLPLIELHTRWELDPAHPYSAMGIPESMSIDQTMHSLFGASKVAADILVQEYGRYFGMRTACFRGGCLTGPNHSGAMLHGFLAYLARCAVTGRQYNVFGYKAKQVRDNIHSADLLAAFNAFFEAPRSAEVYNIGGGFENSVSILEAFEKLSALTGRVMHWEYSDQARIGDHICYYNDLSKMQEHYPAWRITRSLDDTLGEIVDRWKSHTTKFM